MTTPPDLTAWIGRTARATDTITAGPVDRLAAILGSKPPVSSAPLPALWHWLFFLPRSPISKIGADGHDQRGEFLPPVTERRRLFAGGTTRFLDTLHLGDEIERTSRIEDAVIKRGRSGRLVFVTIVHEIMTERGLAITERQEIVFTDAVPSTPDERRAAVPESIWSAVLIPDTVMLFQFSALTFNSHRIHYDAGYATGVEGYPNLVVHGPLVALALANLAASHLDKPPQGFTFRARAPFFVDNAVELRGSPSPVGANLAAYTPTGEFGMEARYITS